MHDFKKLIVWQKSMELVKDVYQISIEFPKEERFGLTSQLKRATFSIPLNIAEGAGRTEKGFINFLRIAYSSAYEVETILILLFDLGFINQRMFDQYSQKIIEIQKMLFMFIKSKEKDFK